MTATDDVVAEPTEYLTLTVVDVSVVVSVLFAILISAGAIFGVDESKFGTLKERFLIRNLNFNKN